METKKRPVVLMIRDGWGWSPSPESEIEKEGNATLMANTPVQDSLLKNNPTSFLTCSGEEVGLPAGQMGNSEVGHLNLGAGRIVYQDLTHISKQIADGNFEKNEAMGAVMEKCLSDGSRLHLMGLVSDGGVHSHQDHIYALLAMAKNKGLTDVAIHCFMDGRDTSPKAGAGYLEALQAKIAEIGVGRIATIVGRYLIMDRDNRWERVTQGYHLIVNGEGKEVADPVQAMKDWYEAGETDEFIPATVIAGQDKPQMRDGDGLICFNYRSDRVREITMALMDDDFDGFERSARAKLNYVCYTNYSASFNHAIAFPPRPLKNTLGEYIASKGLAQLRTAETEKYPHVTFFFNGGIEVPNEGEERLLSSSPKVATYDLQPEMSAPDVTDKVCESIRSDKFDVVIINFANPDMVGHTGSIPATMKAVEATDQSVGLVLDAVKDVGGVALVTADHGNAEQMFDAKGEPHTAHTTNLVHIFYIGDDADQVKMNDGKLADVSPTILALLGLPQPEEMTGTSLISK
ncbi:2,3-bisphosphoglycerate-independent phosphoglycerate mutase [Verrucomicrobia bacterium]|nr:2,3-bisphosphoglycerate-independent phosphoglycerate mutase [Verrucomicrobiota bacterium]